MKKYLSLKVETSGINYKPNKQVSDGYQILSAGLIVCDDNFKELDSLYVEIKYDGESIWDSRAEQAHKLTKEYLDSHGVDQETAIVQISNFLLKHYDSDGTIELLGYNPHNFDFVFLKNFLYKYELYFNFSSNCLDCHSLSMGTFGIRTQNELYRTLFNETPNTSLHKAKLNIQLFRDIKYLWKKYVEEKIN